MFDVIIKHQKIFSILVTVGLVFSLYQYLILSAEVLRIIIVESSTILTYTVRCIIAYLIFLTVQVIVSYIYSKQQLKSKYKKGTRIILTGAARGLGKELALALSTYKPRLVLVDVQGDLLDKTVDECKKLGALEVITLVYDLSTYKNCRLTISTFKKVDNGFREVIEKSIAVLGGIDIVLFNHVLMTNNFAENLTYGEVERSVSVNLLSHIYLSNLTIPHLKQSKGHICAVASIGGHLPVPRFSIYSSTKHGMIGTNDFGNNDLLVGFFDTLRIELSTYDINVTIIKPGPMKTEGSQELAEQFFKKHFESGLFIASPKGVAKGIVKAVAMNKNEWCNSYFLDVLKLVRTIFPNTFDSVITFLLKLGPVLLFWLINVKK